MTEVWFGEIDEIFGYGVSVISDSEKECKKQLKKAFYAMRKAYGSTTTFDSAFEDWGGIIKKIKLDQHYFGGLRE